MNYRLISTLPDSVLNPGTKYLKFAFDPQKGHGGSSTATAVVHSNNTGGGANNISLLGYSCERTTQATPDSLFVGVVVDTSLSQQDVVTLTNSGNCPLGLSRIQITGPDSGLYKLIPPVPTAIAPNANVKVTVEFKSNRVNSQTPIASLTISTDSKSEPVVTLPLLARGCYFHVTAVPTPSSVLFANDVTPVGSKTSTTILLQNTGCIPLQISGHVVYGPDKDEFPDSMVTIPTGYIQPGGIDSATVTFTRTTAGTPQACLSFSTNSPEIQQIQYSLGAAGACITGVRQPDVTVNAFALFQNYPNPFNPTTKISYDVAQYGAVKLEVLNTLGQPVAVLENSNMVAGHYTTTFDASSLPSGTYFYRLTAGEYTKTRVMNMIK